MKASVDVQMKLIGLNIEHIVRSLDSLTLKQKVDVGAHIKSLSRLCDSMDEAFKAQIKTKLGNKGGVVLGENFKAVLAYHEESRFNIKRLKEEKPAVYKQFLKTSDVGVIKYEPR